MSADQQSSNKGEFTVADLHNIKSLIDQRGDNDGYTPTFLQVIAEKIDYKLKQIQKSEEELKRTRVVPEEVNNFSVVSCGTLVKDCGFGTFREPRTGIVVGLTYFKDDLCGVVCWPEIHWEGQQFPCLTHPARAMLHNGQSIPKIVINGNHPQTCYMEEVDVLEAIEILRKGVDHE